MIKAGYKTSEFWFTVVSFIFSGLYLVGVLKENDQKEQLISIVSHAVESVILISGQMFIFYRYIKGRNEVKKIAEQERITKTQIEQEEPNNDTKRNDNSRSRKTTPRNKTKSTKSKKRSPK
jgi:hypothetical protein